MCGYRSYGLGDRSDRVRSRIDECSCAAALRGDHPCSERHPAVRDRRPVLDDEHRRSDERRAVLERHRRVRANDGRVGVDRPDVAEDPFDRCRVGAVDLVDHDDVGHPQVRLSRVVGELVAGPQRVDDDDQQVGPEEGEVVVAAVPDDQVGLRLRLREDLGVVDARVHDHARLDRGLVLLALLDRRMGGVDVGERREPLYAHPLQVAVRHRMPDEDDVEPGAAQDPADPAARLALAAAGADGADGDDGTAALEHRPFGAEQPEVGARGEHARGLVHHVEVGEVRVREHDLVHPLAADQGIELLLVVDRDPVRVERSGESRRVSAVGDARESALR